LYAAPGAKGDSNWCGKFHALIGWAKGRTSNRRIMVTGLADYVGEILPKLIYQKFGFEHVPKRGWRGIALFD